MLVLSRKPGQSLDIGDDIQIVVQRVVGNRVTLGIQAPRQVGIRRGELEPEPGEPSIFPEFEVEAAS